METGWWCCVYPRRTCTISDAESRIPNVGSALGRRLRRRPSAEPTFIRHPMTNVLRSAIVDPEQLPLHGRRTYTVTNSVPGLRHDTVHQRLCRQDTITLDICDIAWSNVREGIMFYNCMKKDCLSEITLLEKHPQIPLTL